MTDDGLSGEGAEGAGSDAASAELGALRAEIAALRARIAVLEGTEGRAAGQAAIVPEPADQPRDDVELRQSRELLQAIVDNSTAVIFVKDCEGRLLLANRRFEKLFHVTRAEALGKDDSFFFPPGVAEQVHANDRVVMDTRAPIELEELVPSDNEYRTYFSIKFPIFDASGAITGVCGIATDITERKRAEQAQAELQQQIIDTQRASLRELSTPLIPLAPGVLAMPLIGTIDSMRARQIMETLLEGITAQRAHIALVDITGVKVVDTQVADALMRAARAARLLGAEVVLTGIGASVAMSLSQLGADLGDVRTLGTLQSGIAYALRGH